MFWDEEYIDEKIDELKDMIENNTFQNNKSNNFISFDDLEDEYSHDDIQEAQQIFIEKAKKYLSKNYSGKYAMWRDWCVHVMTVGFYKDIMFEYHKNDDKYIKTRESIDIII